MMGCCRWWGRRHTVSQAVKNELKAFGISRLVTECEKCGNGLLIAREDEFTYAVEDLGAKKKQ